MRIYLEIEWDFHNDPSVISIDIEPMSPRHEYSAIYYVENFPINLDYDDIIKFCTPWEGKIYGYEYWEHNGKLYTEEECPWDCDYDIYAGQLIKEYKEGILIKEYFVK